MSPRDAPPAWRGLAGQLERGMEMTFSFRRSVGQGPRVYGHRGARGVWPENTLESFEALYRAGFSAVEIDVQNACGVPVVIHDPLVPMQLARDPEGRFLPAPGPKICTLSPEALCAYDVGRLNPATAYAAQFPDQNPVDGARVPLFADFCAWAQGVPEMVLNVEIKSFADRADLGDPPDVLARSVLDIALGAGLEERLILSSFDWRVLAAARAYAPQVCRAYLSEEHGAPGEANIFDGSAWMDGVDRADHGGSLARVIAAADGQGWCPCHRELTAEALDEAHGLGLFVNVWTVNTPEEARHFAALGVDGIITDYPDRIRAALAPRHGLGS